MATQPKKELIIEAVLDYLLSHGLQDSGIRTLAKHADISDRMLIYYYGNKDALLAEALSMLTDRTADGLNLLVGEGLHDAEAILQTLDQAGDIPEFEDAMRLFLEVIAMAARGIEPYRSAAKNIVAYWRTWLSERLAESEDGPSADELLDIIEGRILLRLVDKA